MSLTIELTPEQEDRLTALARSQGMEPSELATMIVTEHLPDTVDSGGTIGALLAPLQRDFENSGMTAEDLGDLIDSTVDRTRRAPKPLP